MNKHIYNLILLTFIGFLGSHSGAEAQNRSSFIQEISNEGKTKEQPYLTAGDKAYIIGLQNGLFPDMGGHVRDEMGGVWTHPIKLADGFWMKIREEINPEGIWLMDADEYITYPYGSEFVYRKEVKGLEVKRLQFAPDQEKGVIVQYSVRNISGKNRDVRLDFLLKTDISPVWFSKENGISDYTDQLEWDNSDQVFSARDTQQEWYMIWGTDSPVSEYEINSKGPEYTTGQGKSGLIGTSLTLAPGEEKTVTYAISGSMKSQDDALATHRKLLRQREELLSEKQASMEQLLEISKVSVPDKHLQTTYNWVRINTRWLEMDLDGFGRFLGAGAIEYPWLFGCDNSYALQGVLATGDFDLAKSTLRMLKDVSEKVNGNGRIIHEMSTNGFIYNKGNTQETAHFIVAVWKTFLWTGDLDFLQDMYPYVKKGIHWLTVEMDNNQNLFPEGYGIMEVSGLNAELIDVAVYTQEALQVASYMANVLNEKSLSDEYAAKSTTLKEKINHDFWDEEEGIYCDFFGSKEQAVSVAKGAVKQLKLGRSEKENENIRFYEGLISHFDELPDGTERGWFTNKNWVINTPLETAIAPEDKAIRSLDKIRNEHCGEYGPYLSAVEGDRMMTIATGVQAVSEAQYSRIDECMWYVDKIAATLNRTLPGSINEMMPDYGCPVQAWTIYGLGVPLIMHVFGVTPDAYRKEVVISPSLPTGWNDIKLENQRVGSNSYDIQIGKTNDKTTYIIKSKENGWKNVLRIKGLSGKDYDLNGKMIRATSDNIVLTGTKNTIVY